MNRIVTHGDCLEFLPTLPENSVDAVVTGPPYHLTPITARPKQKSDKAPSRGFLGYEWDGGDISFRAETWRKCLRILKPGGYLCAFGAQRNLHRLIVAIEEADFEYRDLLMWLYGNGFPKSRDIGRAVNATHEHENKWAGWGTALKPACAPIVLARKPLSEPTVTDNVMKWGTGELNFAACGNSRLRYAPRASRYEREVGLTIAPEKWQGFGINPARLRRNTHPTVQPVSVMRWLCRFVTPPRGLVLDPFAGSGTTGIAAVLEGFAFQLIEQDARYAEIARQRVAHATRFPRDFLPRTPPARRTKLLDVNGGGLFD